MTALIVTCAAARRIAFRTVDLTLGTVLLILLIILTALLIAATWAGQLLEQPTRSKP